MSQKLSKLQLSPFSRYLNHIQIGKLMYYLTVKSDFKLKNKLATQ